MVKKKYYDPRVFELAKLFLSDEPQLDYKEMRESLAVELQAVIEDFIVDQLTVLNR